ncbi:MAG TPA: hypothetical protein VM659_08230 [Dongiaceae bacterium]|nr:hypothetical protein [Dongiaceae bacterium]
MSTVIWILGACLQLMVNFAIVSCLPAIFGIWRGRKAPPLPRLPFAVRTLGLAAVCFVWLAILGRNAVAENMIFLGIATLIIWMSARIYQMRLIVRRLIDSNYPYYLTYWCLIPCVDLGFFLWLCLKESRPEHENVPVEIF